jgi:hypothetical protein
MVSPDDEFPWPEVRSPVVDCLDEPNQLTLVGDELQVMRRDGPTEGGDWADTLMQNRTNARTRCVIVDNEGPREVRQLQN